MAGLPVRRRLVAIGIAAFGLAVVALALSPAGQRVPGGPGGTPSAPGNALPSTETETEIPVPVASEPETGEYPDLPGPRIPDRVDLYVGSVSVLPGQPVELHVSTSARTYFLSIERLDATLPGDGQVVAQLTDRPGHDERASATVDSRTLTARANWPVTDTVWSNGWSPGVYVVNAGDARRTEGRAIFVVRTPIVQSAAPMFVFSALTYQAYNLWGGANLYTYAGPQATQVSFERPYLAEDGLGYWERDDNRILAWLQLRHLDLQYTTDYDLGVAAPEPAPRLLILPRHTEYVPEGMRDWVEQHVNRAGDMNVLNFGSNSFYWRVRLVPPVTPGAPMDVVCYKRLATDPVAASDPADATVRWRSAPLGRPEGEVLGAQFVSVLDAGSTRFNFTVTASMPAALLDGTGWTAGTVLHGLLKGEGDDVYPGVGATAIMDGLALDSHGATVSTSVTIRTSPAGARVFDAGTFAWADGFAPPLIRLGIADGTFDRFTENVLGWLGFPAGV